MNDSLVNLTSGNPNFAPNTLLLDPNATGGVTPLSAFIQVRSVPKPSSLAMLGIGAAGFVGYRYRRNYGLAS